MDDFVLSNLNESKNEWSERLISILVPHIYEGIRSVFIEANKLAVKQNEPSKYLMTFQSLLSNVPSWNAITLKEEVERIVEKSGCNYISDLIACVHIIQLKILTCIKVSQKYKKMDIEIPKLELFIHGVYIHVAREIYKNVYLFEKKISSLQEQKNQRCIEIIIRHCILKTMRDSIPTEQIVKAYLDESFEPIVEQEEIIVENPTPPPPSLPSSSSSIPFVGGTSPPPPPLPVSTLSPSSSISTETLCTESNPVFSKMADDALQFRPPSPSTNSGGIKFNNMDYMLSEDNKETVVEAPKTDEYVNARNEMNRQKMQWADNEYDDEPELLQIHTDKPVQLNELDICEL